MNGRSCRRTAATLVGSFGVVLLAGCGNSVLTTSSAELATPTLTGRVHGGQQPISGASLSLYAAGTSGYGMNAESLLGGTTVTTDADGGFSIPGSFACPSPKTQVYLVSTGGDTGSGINDHAVLMSALGNCGDLSSLPSVDISEVSTVASVYPLSQFMTAGSTAIGTSSSNVTGLENAFATVTNLLNTSSGVARRVTPAGNGKVPQSTINTVANILASCINSLGRVGPCPALFSAATPPGGSAPTDTLAALVNIAKNPGSNVTQLYNLPTAQGTYQPSLSAAPADFTLSIEYTGGGLHQGQLPAVDAQGNVWVPNHLDPGTISEFSPVGQALSGGVGFSGGGLSYPEAVAADLSGNVWAANEGNGTVSEHTAGGTPLSGSGFTMNGMEFPYALAIDGNGSVFTANGNNTVAKFSSTGAAQMLMTGGGLDVPYAVAIDGAENVWVANGDSDPQANTLSKFSNAGVPASTTGFSGGGLSVPYFVAVDATGDVWAANFYAPAVSKMSRAGAPLSGSGYAVPSEVSALAVDGDNTVWTANTDGSVSHLANTGTALSPAGGYVAADAMAAVGLVIDASGNVWTTDYYVDSLFEYVGAAAPVTVPMALAVKNNTLGVRP